MTHDLFSLEIEPFDYSAKGLGFFFEFISRLFQLSLVPSELLLSLIAGISFVGQLLYLDPVMIKPHSLGLHHLLLGSYLSQNIVYFFADIFYREELRVDVRSRVLSVQKSAGPVINS